MDGKRKKAWRAGFRAEQLAALYLVLCGYRILARRYRTPFGEIDLVAARGNRLAFVEVKRRKSADEALLAVTPAQQRRIRRAAAHWLAGQRVPHEGDTGLDVIVVRPWRIPQHYRDVFSHAPS